MQEVPGKQEVPGMQKRSRGQTISRPQPGSDKRLESDTRVGFGAPLESGTINIPDPMVNPGETVGLASAPPALDALYRELQQRLGAERVELWLDQQVTFQLEGWGSQDGSKGRSFGALGGHLQAGTSSGDLTLRVAAPTQFQLDWLRRRLLKPLRACCQHAWQRDVNIVFQVWAPHQKGLPIENGGPEDTELAAERGAERAQKGPGLQATNSALKSGPSNSASLSVQLPQPSACRKSVGATGVRESSGRRDIPSGRRPIPTQHGTFATFVAGSCNTLAHNTAKLVAEQPGRYCPLLLYGPSGVGKSHLLSAIRQQVLCQRDRRQSAHGYAIGLTSEEFTSQFLEALNCRSLPSFRQKYRTLEVLLVDDIQFLARKRATLEELLHTIDTLHNRGSQIVLASDRGPSDLQSVSPDLVSRISSGLAVPMDLPDYETRAGIVRNLALRMKVTLDPQVVTMIATQVAGSARQLSGALNRLLAVSMALGQPITPELARTALAEFSQQNTPSVRLPDIQRAVCEVFGVEPASLKSKRKSRSATEPRMLAMWLARKYTRSALSEISDFFGRRSHSTVISAQKKVESLLKSQQKITVADRPCQLEEAIRRVETALRRA